MRLALNRLKEIDSFTRNIILVFIGTALVNFCNLLYQLLIAHKLPPVEFAAFNSLLSVFVVIYSPLTNLQTAVAKYSAEFNALNQPQKVGILLSGLLRKALWCAVFSLVAFHFLSFYIIAKLKISCTACVYILPALLALAWITPILAGGVQGLELFKWFTSASLVNGVLKLTCAFVFIMLGLNIAGALGAFLFANLTTIIILLIPMRNFIFFRGSPGALARGNAINGNDYATASAEVNYKEIFLYILPVIISTFCFTNLVNMDMILVKYFFAPQDSGFYALAQMVGKIFLFLPGAVSLVMFPKTSGLKAKKMDTSATLRKSLLYSLGLCIMAFLVYNAFPGFILRVLTGKAIPDSIILGRLFSISMSFFALLYILLLYFLSIKDLRFIAYLVLFTLLQFFAIVLFHRSLFQVQLILCANAILLFCLNLILALKNRQSQPLLSL